MGCTGDVSQRWRCTLAEQVGVGATAERCSQRVRWVQAKRSRRRTRDAGLAVIEWQGHARGQGSDESAPMTHCHALKNLCKNKMGILFSSQHQSINSIKQEKKTSIYKNLHKKCFPWLNLYIGQGLWHGPEAKHNMAQTFYLSKLLFT